MERLLLRILLISCLASTPFIIKRKNLGLHLTIFFAKGVLATAVDSYCIKRKKIEYPYRPYPKTFDSNILFDLLFFPLLSVIWIRWSYNSKLFPTILKSLAFSGPMTFIQYLIQKKTNLVEWKNWTSVHTFVSINFTLYTIKGFIALVRRFAEPTILTNAPQEDKLLAPEFRELRSNG